LRGESGGLSEPSADDELGDCPVVNDVNDASDVNDATVSSAARRNLMRC
jgi:hypothetical protein